MDRRQFLRNSSLIAVGVIAADQLEILERLTWKRTIFPSAAVSKDVLVNVGDVLLWDRRPDGLYYTAKMIFPNEDKPRRLIEADHDYERYVAKIVDVPPVKIEEGEYLKLRQRYHAKEIQAIAGGSNEITVIKRRQRA